MTEQLHQKIARLETELAALKKRNRA